MPNTSYITKVYGEQGGERLVIASGGSCDVESGGEIDIESGGLLKIAGSAAITTITFAAAEAGTNVCEVTITMKDGVGNTLAYPLPITIWLSDASTGAGLTGTSASGTVQAKAASGADFAVLSAKKALIAQPLATGVYILEITDSAKTGFYVCASSPLTGKVFVSTQLVTGNYG